ARQGDFRRRHRPAGWRRISPADPAARTRWPHRLYQPRLHPERAQGPGDPPGRPARRDRAYKRAVAVAARGETELVSARQPPRSELLVLGRSAGDGRRRASRTRRCRAILYRRRYDAEPGRLAAGRRDAAELAERPSAIRDHL